MYCVLGTVKECEALRGKLPERVYEEILRGVAVLSAEYGENRDYFETGGYSLVADTEKDLCWARRLFDERIHACEWSTRLGNSGYVSSLYLLNNEFSVMLYTKESIASKNVLDNLED